MVSKTPVGVLLLSALISLYGVMWALYWYLSLRQPTVWTGIAPPLTFGLFGLAIGLWNRLEIAWYLALGLFGFGLLWTLFEMLMGENRLTALVVAVLSIGYLIGRRELFASTDDSRA